MFPMGDEHVVAYGLVAMIHCLFKSRHILGRTFLDYLTKHLPVFSDVIVAVLLCVADSPVASYREDDVIFMQNFLKIRELIGMVEEIFC